MQKPYSQVRAMLAITRASLKAVFRSPSAVIFSLAFPLIFILVFGFIGNSGRLSVRVAIDKNTDTTSAIYKAIVTSNGLSIVNKPQSELDEDLEKGRLAAIIQLAKNNADVPSYIIK